MLILDTDLTQTSSPYWNEQTPLPLHYKCGWIGLMKTKMRGWLGYIAQANTIEKMLLAYERLQTHLQTFRDLTVLPFDLKAAQQFERLRQVRIRIGTMDLKIAAICLANDATLLTRNLKDFGQVPGLKFEDWSV